MRFGRLHQELHQEVNALGAEVIAGRLEVRLFGAMARVRDQLGLRLRRHTRAEAHFRASRELPLQTSEFMVIFVLVIALIALKNVFGLEPATFAASLGFFLFVSQRLMNNFMMLLTQRMKLISCLPSMQLVDATLLDAHVRERTTGVPFTGLDGDIVFRGVTFAYEPGRDVLRGLNLTIPRGRITALIGPSGSGKSTIADLLLGLLAPQAGSIRLGSHAIENLSLASLRAGIGYVSQDPMIFNASVRDTIRFSGEKGTILWTASPNRVAVAVTPEAGYKPGDADGSWNETNYACERNDMFVAVAREFLGVVRGEAKPSCTIADGERVLRVIEAARASHATGAVVRIA